MFYIEYFIFNDFLIASQSFSVKISNRILFSIICQYIFPLCKEKTGNKRGGISKSLIIPSTDSKHFNDYDKFKLLSLA